MYINGYLLIHIIFIHDSYFFFEVGKYRVASYVYVKRSPLYTKRLLLTMVICITDLIRTLLVI